MFRSLAQGFRRQRQRGQLIRSLTTTPEDNDQREQLVAEEDWFNRQVMITGLTSTTAVIHIFLGGQLFILNGVGFLALLGAHYALPKRESYQKYTRDALFGYTGLTVAAYFLKYGTGGFNNVLGLGTKLVELGLMRVLWEDRVAAGPPAAFLLENGAEAAEEMVTS